MGLDLNYFVSLKVIIAIVEVITYSTVS